MVINPVLRSVLKRDPSRVRAKSICVALHRAWKSMNIPEMAFELAIWGRHITSRADWMHTCDWLQGAGESPSCYWSTFEHLAKCRVLDFDFLPTFPGRSVLTFCPRSRVCLLLLFARLPGDGPLYFLPTSRVTFAAGVHQLMVAYG